MVWPVTLFIYGEQSNIGHIVSPTYEDFYYSSLPVLLWSTSSEDPRGVSGDPSS